MPVALAVNDDGIDSPGLRSLVLELSQAGFKVYVAAPAQQMSGISKTVSFNRFGRNGRIEFRSIEMDGATACWALNATPAESVLIALRLLLEERPHIVVSGVNSGPNMGLEDILTSGTVGAAIEAVLNGLPAVAVSLAHRGSADERDYRVAARVAARLSRLLVDSYFFPHDTPVLLNVNVPLNPRGVMATVPALNNYRSKFRINGDFVEAVREDFEERYWDRRPGTDVWAVLNNYISITAINVFNLLESSIRFKSKLEDLIKMLALD